MVEAPPPDRRDGFQLYWIFLSDVILDFSFGCCIGFFFRMLYWIFLSDVVLGETSLDGQGFARHLPSQFTPRAPRALEAPRPARIVKAQHMHSQL